MPPLPYIQRTQVTNACVLVRIGLGYLASRVLSGSNVQNNSYFRYKDAVTSFFRSGQVRSGVVGVLIFNMYLLLQF
jgi:hypothetical protein